MVSGEASSMREASVAFGRLVEIGLIVAAHGGRFALMAVASTFRRRRPPLALRFGEALADLFQSLGPTFIKLGQILSARPDLLPPSVAGPLARLQDQIAPCDARLIPGLLQEAFGRPQHELFAAFDSEPLSCASVAQVHRARLADGRSVAVKIRRPGIVRRVERDFLLLRLLARTAARLPGMQTVPATELIDELEPPIREQLDLAREAQSLRRLRRNFAGHERIRIPAPIDELCCASVLTMEHLADLEKVTSPRFTTSERRVAAQAGLRALYKMIFVDGFIHTDMHPGNVFLRSWGELVLLDLGLVTVLDATNQRDFSDFFFGIVCNDGRACARVVWDTALYRSPRSDRAAFESAMVELIGRHSALRSRDFEITLFVYQLMETQRRFGIRGSTKFIMTVLSMVVYDGICKQLYPECDFQSEARGYLMMARYRGQPTAHAL